VNERENEASAVQNNASPATSFTDSTPAQEVKADLLEFNSKSQRYISQKIKHAIWLRDKGQCQGCGSKRNLHYDHIRPVAHGGQSETANLQLLCFHCNERRAIKTFGAKCGGF
jgi:5-methylcytosine-specific restriction endonuclease McrA